MDRTFCPLLQWVNALLLLGFKMPLLYRHRPVALQSEFGLRIECHLPYHISQQINNKESPRNE